MKITQSKKEAEIAKILLRNDINHENARITISELSAEWPATGLRMQDLTEGLRDLVASGVLVQDRYDGVEGVTLTAVGGAYMDRHHGLMSNLLDGIKSMFSPVDIRKRERSVEPVPQTRRADDRQS